MKCIFLQHNDDDIGQNWVLLDLLKEVFQPYMLSDVEN
jgi:hypothetical protein